MIGLNELFDEIRKKKKLNFKVYYSWFEAIPNNFNVTAKTMFLLSIEEKNCVKLLQTT